jgi:hypothetical protein
VITTKKAEPEIFVEGTEEEASGESSDEMHVVQIDMVSDD